MLATGTAMRVRKGILIVEDDRGIRETLAQILDDEGYATATACNGRDALNTLAAGDTTPELILLDLWMPVMDGWQFAAELARDPELGSTPLLLVTADARVPQETIPSTAVACFRKPLALQQLLDTVARCCSPSTP